MTQGKEAKKAHPFGRVTLMACVLINLNWLID
jgi:hypothetical protein